MAIDKKGRKLPKGIRQRSKNYEGRFTYNYKEYSVTGKTITETQKAMTELRYKLEHGLYVPKQKMTLNDWFKTWMEEYKKNKVKQDTYIEYTNRYRAIIQKELGEKYIQDIRGEHIQRLFNNMFNKGYSDSSIHTVQVILTSCFSQAVKNGLVEKTPLTIVEVPKNQKKKQTHAMSRQEQELFMQYAKDSYMYNLFDIMLRTGMRNGEARGLKYMDIDRKKQVIKINRTLVKLAGIGQIENTPKTKASEREIPITAAIMQAIDNQKAQYEFKVDRIDRYIFCDEKGEAFTNKHIQYEIDRITKQIRKDGHEFNRITSHVFRHTFATRAIEAGMQPQVLKVILGHSSLAMTMDLYSHVLPDTKAQEMEKIANVF